MSYNIEKCFMIFVIELGLFCLDILVRVRRVRRVRKLYLKSDNVNKQR